MANFTPADDGDAQLIEWRIRQLADRIAQHRPVYSITSSPLEIARALYLEGWTPPEVPARG